MIYTFDSAMAGAPVLSGTAGTLRAVLKSCLVDGFGAGIVASLSVASGVATATFSAAHPYRVGSIVQIGGATPAELNGKQRVLSTTASAITFDATGVADGAATGTITHKVAPVGWQELFAGSVPHVLCIKPSVPEATGCVLRLDDTGTIHARVVGYEAMQDASTGTGPFPTEAQMAGGLYWLKSDAADASARLWWLVADARALYLFVQGESGFSPLFGFGDLVSNKAGDAYGCLLAGSTTTDRGGDMLGCLGLVNTTLTNSGKFVARSHTFLGTSRQAMTVSALVRSGFSGGFGEMQAALNYPSGADNSLRVSSVELVCDSTLRGRVPGVHHTPQTIATGTFANGDRVPGSGPFAGRTLMALCVARPAVDSQHGTAFVDVTGPWR